MISREAAEAVGWDEKTTAMMEEQTRRVVRAGEIVKERGWESLPGMTQIIMGGDYEVAERIEKAMRDGTFLEQFDVAGKVDPNDPDAIFDHALIFAGSFSRLDLAYRLYEAGFTTMDHLCDTFVHWWPGSDPDDTDLRFVKVWRRARQRNGGRYVRDGKHLRRGNPLTVYRGQPPGAPIGCAWSLDRKVADKFARGAWARVPVAEGEIIKLEIPRNQILAYLTSRHEEEIIIDPRGIERTET